MIDARAERFAIAGRTLLQLGIVDSHSGNLSERAGEDLVITRRGSMLGQLEANDLLQTGVRQAGAGDKDASSELIVHRAAYAANPEIQAIAHAHPVLATAMAFHHEAIAPMDSEAKAFLGERVPVVVAEPPAGSRQAAVAVAKAFKQAKVVIIRSHGAFAAAPDDVLGAIKLLSALEHAAKIIYYADPERFWGR